MKATLQVLQSSNTVNFLKKDSMKPETKEMLKTPAVLITATTLAFIAFSIFMGITAPPSLVVFIPVSAVFLLIPGLVATLVIANDPKFFKGCLENVMKDIKKVANTPPNEINAGLKELGKAIKKDVIEAINPKLEAVKNELGLIKQDLVHYYGYHNFQDDLKIQRLLRVLSMLTIVL